MVEPSLKILVGGNLETDDPQVAVISLRVDEFNGVRNVQINGSLQDMLAALMDADMIFVSVNNPESLPQA